MSLIHTRLEPFNCGRALFPLDPLYGTVIPLLSILRQDRIQTENRNSKTLVRSSLSRGSTVGSYSTGSQNTTVLCLQCLIMLYGWLCQTFLRITTGTHCMCETLLLTPYSTYIIMKKLQLTAATPAKIHFLHGGGATTALLLLL